MCSGHSMLTNTCLGNDLKCFLRILSQACSLFSDVLQRNNAQPSGEKGRHPGMLLKVYG